MGSWEERERGDGLFERGFRPRLGTPSIPRYPAPRGFACAIASAWLAGTAAAFHWRAMTLGYALGASLVAAAAVPTFSGFCIPSWVYGLAGRRRGDPPAEAATTVERASVT
jgi:hypothetical protein